MTALLVDRDHLDLMVQALDWAQDHLYNTIQIRKGNHHALLESDLSQAEIADMESRLNDLAFTTSQALIKTPQETA